MPPHLFTFFNKLIREAFVAAMRKGRRRPNTMRDIQLVRVIATLVFENGLNATRNEATTSCPSACSIVAESLAENGIGITESAVVAIWSRRRDLPVLNK